MTLTPQDVCRIKNEEANLSHVAHGRLDLVHPDCFHAKRNAEEARVAAGLNPRFSGCPGCSKEARLKTEEAIREDMRQFMEVSIYQGAPKREGVEMKDYKIGVQLSAGIWVRAGTVEEAREKIRSKLDGIDVYMGDDVHTTITVEEISTEPMETEDVKD